MSDTRSALQSFGGVTLILVLGQIINLVFLAVSSRLLKPAEFGVFSVCLIVIAFSDMITDSGVGASLIQKKKVFLRTMRIGLSLALMISSIMCAVVFLFSGSIAQALRVPEAKAPLQVLSFVVMINGLTNYGASLLQRSGKAVSFTAIETVARAASNWFVAIPLLLLGWSYWALVVAFMFGAVIAMVATLWRAKAPLQPSWNARIARDIFAKGGGFFTAKIFAYLNNNVDRIVVSNAFGSATLGLYSRGFSLIALINGLVGKGLSRVAFPAMARSQADMGRLGRGMLKSLSLAVLMVGPASVFLFFNAQPLVLVLLGEDWVGAAPILQALSALMFTRTITNVFTTFFRALGLVEILVAHNAFYTVVSIVAVFVGVRFGAVGVAVAITLTSLANMLTYGFQALRHSRLAFSNLMQAILVPLAGTLLLAMVLQAALAIALASGTLTTLILHGALYGMAMLAILYAPRTFFSGGANAVVDLRMQLGEVLQKIVGRGRKQ